MHCCALLGIIPVLHRHYLLVVESCQQVCLLSKSPIYEIKQVGLISFEHEETLSKIEKNGELSLEEKEHHAQLLNYIDYLKNSLLV